MLKPEQGPGDMGVLAKQVPKASITALRGLICCGCDTCLSKAIAAAIRAWPGAYQTTGYNTYFENLFDHVVIPLPQEPSDEQ